LKDEAMPMPAVIFRTSAVAALVLLTVVALLPQRLAAQDLSPVEKIYAELAKMPPAERQKRLEDGAKKEGKLSVVHTLRGELGNGHLALFQKRYPFVKMDSSVDIGSQDAAERLVAEESVGRHLTDIITGGLPDFSEPLRRNFLARYDTPAMSAILPQYRRFEDPENRWMIFYWSEHGISYNPKLVPAGKEPKQWMDLCDPVFKGSVSFDPAEARYLSGIYAIFGSLEKTEAFLKCIGANDPIIQRGHSQRIELMVAGDHMVQGDNYLYHGLTIQKKNPQAPYAIVYTAPMMAMMGVGGINRNAPNPYAAALFADWTITEESQTYLAGQYRGPVTIKHPYLPDSVTLVDNNDPPKEIADKLMAMWMTYIEKRKK
jgi:iron(III) transport system substrate-binding protein